MNLIPNGAFRSIGNAERGLITNGIFMLVAAKFAPGCMEFTRHAEVLHPQGLGVAGRQWEVVIAPAACRQALQLQVGAVMGRRAVPALNMPAIMKHRQARLNRVHGLSDAPGIGLIDLLRQLINILLIVGVQAALQQGMDTALTVAGLYADNIKEDPVRVIAFSHLFNLSQHYL